MKKNAFTLIELLVVTIIIALLVGMAINAVPKVSRTRNNPSQVNSTSVPNARRATDVFDNHHFEIGDRVAIIGIATGIVNRINSYYSDILVRNTDGSVSMVNGVRLETLKRVE